MEREFGEPELDAVDAAQQIESLLGMAERLMSGTFTPAFGLDVQGRARMVEALYAQVGRLPAGIVRARGQA
ncbi:hypothetical protein ABZ851_29940 [Streptomyces sp. NPDC047049]|uniref:hypothetical protein n=1 Tax=Streptomyces sp. NPDC047049 TaxID=3156688 RepID=UPI0033CFE54D